MSKRKVKIGRSFQFEKIRIDKITLEMSKAGGGSIQDLEGLVVNRYGIEGININGGRIKIFGAREISIFNINSKKSRKNLIDKLTAAVWSDEILEIDKVVYNEVEYGKKDSSYLKPILRPLILKYLTDRITTLGKGQRDGLNIAMFFMLMTSLVIWYFMQFDVDESFFFGEIKNYRVIIVAGGKTLLPWQKIVDVMGMSFAAYFLSFVLGRFIDYVKYLRN